MTARKIPAYIFRVLCSGHLLNALPMLLDLTFFRRDQIWFAEKDEKSCATELYSLASFSPRKGENIRKGYLQGRFGAIPFIGGDGLWQE